MPRFFRYKLDHLIFWLLTLFFHGYTHLSWIEQAGTGQFLAEVIVRNGLLACAVYFTLLFALPRLTGKEIGVGMLSGLLAIAFYVIGKNLHDAYFYGQVLGDSQRSGFFYHTLYNLSIVLFYLAFASTLHLSKQWYLQRERMRQVETEKLNTELEYLRAQINPHFLFNSINTIYFQIDKQNQTARNTLEKFSDMLRYQLYECTDPVVSIEKEIQYLKNYVALQSIRLNNNYKVSFHADPLTGFSIPPLLLIPFIENAFKHVSNHAAGQNEITIALSQASGFLHLKVANSKENIKPKNEAGGIGLKNVTRRLDLLYVKNYTLSIDDQAQTFSVDLKIPTV